MKQANDTDTAGRILDRAEALFARRGFDGTSTRQIAAEAGISIQTLHYHCDGKLNLYHKVLERSMVPVTSMINEHVQRMLGIDLNDAGALQGAIDSFIDELFDMLHHHPQYPPLFLRQWLEQEPDLRRVEWEHLVPILKYWADRVEAQVDEGRRGGTDIPLLFLSLSWIYWGLLVNPDFTGAFLGVDPDSPEYLERLKRHARQMTGRMLGSPESPANGKEGTQR
jgi:AcrR family transcriptional regulator